MPTLLEAIGIEPPAELGGVEQRPLDGASFLASLTDGAAPSARTTQYYEMLGCRAIYDDGWKAVVFHPMVGFAYEGSDPNLPFDDDPWELYHVAEDFSETREPGRRGARAAARPRRAVVVGGRAQPGPAAHQPAGPPRRPASPPRALRVRPRHRRAAERAGAEPAQPRVPHPRRSRPAGRRRRRRPRHPRRRVRRLRPVPAGRPGALDVQPARRRRSRRCPATSCRPGRARSG